MEVLHDSKLEALFAELYTVCAVEHFVFQDPPAYNPHRAVALASLYALKSKFAARTQLLWKMTIDQDEFDHSQGTYLSPRRFLGPEFDWKSKQFIPIKHRESTDNYLYVLRDPVHGSGASITLCEQVCDALFGDIASLEIYAWPTDCSNFFDFGKEWWGTFFWTVYSPTHNWYVGILASSTD